MMALFYLSDRVFGILREKNPELTGERRRTVLKPPQVGEQTSESSWTDQSDLSVQRDSKSQVPPLVPPLVPIVFVLNLSYGVQHEISSGSP